MYSSFCFPLNDTASTDPYTLSLHDALPICPGAGPRGGEIVAQGKLEDILRAKNSLTADYLSGRLRIPVPRNRTQPRTVRNRSEEHTSELQSPMYLVCRLLLEKKKKKKTLHT